MLTQIPEPPTKFPTPPIKKKKFSFNVARKMLFMIKVIVVFFAFAGFGLTAAYLAVNFHWTDTKGIVDEQTDNFWKNGQIAAAAISGSTRSDITEDIFFNNHNYCLLKTIKDQYPGDFRRIFDLALADEKDLAQKNLDAVVMVLSADTNNGQDFSSKINSCNNENNSTNITQKDFELLADMVDPKSPFEWASSAEWDFFKTSVLKDKDVLAKVQAETGINSRILISQLMAEQMRMFYSDRPWFKKAIEPLKVLGSMTQLSWGVMGLKDFTAETIESNLKNPKSAFYPGKDYENLLDFQTADTQQERFKRITNSDDHYYAYLYAALYNKEIITQWQKAGFDISDKPEILATLYNIGFDHSKPNANPQVGGSELSIGDQEYSFGRLAYEFYYSGELLDEFPQYIKATK